MGNMCSIKGSKNEAKPRNLRQKCTSAVETIRKSLKFKSKKSSNENLSTVVENTETTNETAIETDNKTENTPEEIQQITVSNEEGRVETEDDVADDVQIHSQMSRDSSIITAIHVEDKMVEFGEEETKTELIKEYLDNYRENENNENESKTETNSSSFLDEILDVKLEVDIDESKKSEVTAKNEGVIENGSEISNDKSEEENTKSDEKPEDASVKEEQEILNLIDLGPMEITEKAE